MLEIAILFRLCQSIGVKARAKGRRAIGYQILLILFWFGGEVLTAFLTALALYWVYDEEFESYIFFAYVAAIAGAALGAWLAFVIVSSLPALILDEFGEPIMAD